jgi:glycosyltransferase involved in cell wall biosynthesis
VEDYPRVYVETAHIPQDELPAVYLGADVFVLPSRGEGWGRPHMEAMAMGRPGTSASVLSALIHIFACSLYQLPKLHDPAHPSREHKA